jgi:hypothetical protein
MYSGVQSERYRISTWRVMRLIGDESRPLLLSVMPFSSC